jgi:hypothetical protein
MIACPAEKVEEGTVKVAAGDPVLDTIFPASEATNV